MRSSLLFIVVASVVLVQTCLADSPYTMTSLSAIRKRDSTPISDSGVTSDEEKDYENRIKIFAPEHKTSLDDKEDIDLFMKENLGFYGLEITSRKSGEDDENAYRAGGGDQFNVWPDGAYYMALWCIRKANDTMHAAMKACGPEDKCDKIFIINTIWGTYTGMDWKKDGVMLYQCVGYTVNKSQCASPIKGGCKTTIVEDFHASMWPADSTVNIIGNGATTISQMATDLDTYAKKHDKNWSLPTASDNDKNSNKGGESDGDKNNDKDKDKGKRSLPRPLNS